ncbi:hypothetical protein ACIBI4_05460 [Streptomyces sp. NPDC050418]|uniref:hypothetical protein n=1 Tax=Streptomyces sp. NPDC050418 TaxID=3365612 RepID=UPI0037B6710A
MTKHWRLLALPVLLATACGTGAGSGGEVCTKVGGYSGVGVQWDPADFMDEVRKGPLHVRICAQETCREYDVEKLDPDPRPSFFIELKKDIGAVSVPVRVTVSAQGRELYDERATVKLRKSQPNGENCEPTLYQGRVTADPERGLVTR